jgi:hypothetical protein
MPEENYPKSEAKALAKTIREYWERRGYAVSIKAVPLELDPSLKGKKQVTGWTIETDMVNGLPKELCRQRTAAEQAQQGVRRRA